jgi:hypothetical protein
MNCNQVIQQMNDVGEAIRDDDQLHAFDVHLRRCADCRAAWEAQQALAAAFVPAYSADITARLERAVAQAANPPPARSGGGLALLGLGLIGVSTLAASVWYLNSPFRDTFTQGEPESLIGTAGTAASSSEAVPASAGTRAPVTELSQPESPADESKAAATTVHGR